MGCQVKGYIYYKNASLKEYESRWSGSGANTPRGRLPTTRKPRERPSPETSENAEHRATKEARRNEESTQRRDEVAKQRMKMLRSDIATILSSLKTLVQSSERERF